jgi:hypothetical protein
MNLGGFSWRRFFGVSAAKARPRLIEAASPHLKDCIVAALEAGTADSHLTAAP